jgi:hypothetical protein
MGIKQWFDKLTNRKNVIFGCFLLLSWLKLSPTIAAEIKQGVKQVSADIATGNSAQRIPKIELSPGYGVNISFIKSGEIVEKVWLDNPSFVSLDVDGCLTGLSQQCKEEGATVIHLRQINRLKLPQLPSTSTSLLTAIARGKSGRKVYLFRVAVGNKVPNYHTIEVISTINTIPESTNFSSINNIRNLQKISRGLNIAQKQGLISTESPLWKRIEHFLMNVKTGKSINIAAHNNGISIQLVNRLIELGNTETFISHPK